MNETILNEALSLALGWGEEWLQPVQERLALLHPDLSRGELDRYNAESQRAMSGGHRLVPECWREPGQSEQGAFSMFKTRMSGTYPWISEKNLDKIYSQGMYYAWKNGEIPL